MDFTKYIQAELLTLIPLLNIVGYYIKNKTKLDSKYIPLILGLTGVIFATVYTVGLNGFGFSGIMTGIVQGLLVAAASVYGHQIYKQSGISDGKEDEDE